METLCNDIFLIIINNLTFNDMVNLIKSSKIIRNKYNLIHNNIRIKCIPRQTVNVNFSTNKLIISSIAINEKFMNTYMEYNYDEFKLNYIHICKKNIKFHLINKNDCT